MKGTSRQIRALLLALTLGVWALLVRSFLPPMTGEASPPPAAKRVYVVTSNDQGKIFFDNSPGNIAFNASGLLSVLDEAARRGVKIHSVVSPSGLGGYVVFVEK
ncbi:MAG TPA: hypothetical protein VH601_24125 [Bryobacteraceae bacterium]|jgi:hypothetical protein